MILKSSLFAGSLLVMSTTATAGVERVPYGDLDITTPAGHAALQRRVNGAVWRTCLFDEKGVLRPSDLTTPCQRVTRKKVSIRVAQLVAIQQLANVRQPGEDVQLVVATQ